MQTLNPLASLRAFKGAPLSCLFALMFANQPVGNGWLSRMTGYSSKPVADALNYLLEMGYVTSNGRFESWQLNSQAVQLPLMNLDTLPSEKNLGTSENSSRRNSDSIPTTATTAIEGEINQSVEAVAESKTRWKNSNSTPKNESKRSRNFSDSRKLLRFANVGEPMASVLAELDHSTPYYIAAHILKAKQDGIKIGLLIHRIRSADPAPELNQRYHLLDCDCFYCDPFRFTPDHGLLDPSDFNIKTFNISLSE